MRAKKISFVNQKGGVGKSSTTINVAAVLKEKNYRVLVVDNEPQATCTAALVGMEQYRYLQNMSLSQLYEKEMQSANYDVHSYIYTSPKEGIDLLPSWISLASTERLFYGSMNREHLLENIIRDVEDEYDYILIDSKPDLGFLMINSLVASDQCIIPTGTSIFDIEGIELLIHTILQVKTQIKPNLTIGGLVFQMVDERTLNDREVIESMRRTYYNKLRIYETMIPYTTQVKRSQKKAGSFIHHAGKGNKAAEAYRNLTEEIINDGKEA